jgi:hypothetical protein
VDNAADDTLVIDTRLTARITRQMRRDPRKLFVRKPKAILTHLQHPSPQDKTAASFLDLVTVASIQQWRSTLSAKLSN